jgi:hypothetical protein
MAQNNGFPKHIIHELKEKLITKKTRATQTHSPHNNKVRDGLLSRSTAPLYIRSPIYSEKLV